MNNNYAFLQDKIFLQQLDLLKIKEQFVKVTVLNWNEQTLQEIQGITISGSVNLDGSSSMRRTATLTVFAEEKDNNLANVDQLFAINRKCFLEVGIVNSVRNKDFQFKNSKGVIQTYTVNYRDLYGDIVWFPLGMYIMFNPSVAHALTGVTISLQLKDKMCLLNGDVGGQIPNSIDFSVQDQIVDMYTGLSIESKKVLVFDIIKQLVNHWGNEKLDNIIISEIPRRVKMAVEWNQTSPLYSVEKQDGSGNFLYLSYDEAIMNFQDGDKFEILNYGDDVGFVYTDFTFPKELGCNCGDTITSILDKIISEFGNYEYFYDVFGKFHFQQKQNYLNMTNVAYWTKEQGQKVGNLPSDCYEADYYRLTKSVYNFSQNQYTTVYNDTLNFNNVKNDFVVWGAVKTGANSSVPCRFHLAIDKKPNLNKHDIVLYVDDYGVTRAAAAGAVDFTSGPMVSISRQSQDWRQQIYYQMLEDEVMGTGENTELNNTYFQYYAELKEQFPKIFDLSSSGKTVTLQDGTIADLAVGFNIDIEKHPQDIMYYLDFIDQNSQLGQYSVNNIGRRSKVVDQSGKGVNCVFEPFIPDYYYLNMQNYTYDQGINIRNQIIEQKGKFIQIDTELESCFTIGGKKHSCFEVIKDLLYQYTHVNNTVSLTTLPIYYLQPNTRITIEDSSSGIYGDYIIQSISLPLDISSTMNISAYKALQKI